MKHFKILFLCFLTTKAFAKVSVETKLKVGAHVKYSKKTWHRNSTVCYPLGAPGDKMENLDEVLVSTQLGNGLYDNSTDIVYNVISEDVFKVNANTLTISYTEEELKHRSVVNLKMTQKVDKAHQVELDSEDCLRVDGLARVQNPNISGEIIVRYKVPQNIWLIKVQQKNLKDIFSLNNIENTENSINSAYELKKNEKFIWVEPGTIISQKIKIPAQSKLSGELGEAQIIFESVFSNKYNVLNKVKNSQLGYKDTIYDDVFIESVASYINEPKLLANYLNSHSINTNISLSDKFFKMANMNIGHDDQAYLKKTLSAMLAFEIAKSVLTDIESYCDEIEIINPILGEKIKVKGIFAAYFWLNRALSRVEAFDLLSIKSFLSKLQKFSNENKTYYEVMANDELRLQLKTSYELLINTINSDTTPFAAALFDLKLVLDHFGSFTKVNTSQDELFQAMNSLADKENEFWVAFENDMRAFNKAGHNVINVQSSYLKLTDMLELNSTVLSLLKNKTHLLDIENNSDTKSFMNKIVSLLAHPVNLFDEDKDIGVDYFDKITAPYKKINGINLLTQKIQSCVKGE